MNWSNFGCHEKVTKFEGSSNYASHPRKGKSELIVNVL